LFDERAFRFSPRDGGRAAHCRTKPSATADPRHSASVAVPVSELSLDIPIDEVGQRGDDVVVG
jgi:hypothetical protein